jgi:hypothetical protein
MAVETINALSGLAPAGQAGSSRVFELAAPNSVAHSGGISPQAEIRFNAAIGRSGSTPGVIASQMPTPVKGMFDALDQVNVQARSVSEYAASAEASGGQLTPGEIVQLTMKCQEFMFQCQLTSNIANRSSDGVQQLFRQQG